MGFETGLPKSEHSKTRNWWVEPPLHPPRLTIRKSPTFQWFRATRSNLLDLIRTFVLYQKSKTIGKNVKSNSSHSLQPDDGGGPDRPTSAPTSDLAGWIKLGNVGLASSSYYSSVQLWDYARARKLQSVGSRGIWNSSGRPDRPAVLPSDQCFIPKCTFSTLDNLTFYVALHCALACPLAVQTSPYFLFNSFASRKSDSNTSPRKHKYVSPGTAFHVVRPVHYYGEIRTSNGAFPKA